MKANKASTRDTPALLAELDRLRPMLERYLLRLLASPEGAEAVASEALARARAAATNAPRKPADIRLWLLRLATGAAEIEWSPRPAWRDAVLTGALERAHESADLAKETTALRGTPEGEDLARAHVAFCLSHALGQLPARHAAALLLSAIWEVSTSDLAEVLVARRLQVETWLDEARGALKDHFDASCALVTSDAPCRQCLDLDREPGAGRGNPLERPGGNSFAARFTILRRERDRPYGRWHRTLIAVLDRGGD